MRSAGAVTNNDLNTNAGKHTLPTGFTRFSSSGADARGARVLSERSAQDRAAVQDQAAASQKDHRRTAGLG